MRPHALSTSCLLLLALLLTGNGCATPSLVEEIPDRARRELADRFPLAEAVEWAAYDGEVYASFYDLESRCPVQMTFDRKGRWRETTVGIENTRLPDPITAYLDENFADAYALAYEVRSKSGTNYGLTVDTPTHIYTLTFSKRGKLLERTEESLDGN
ncbi:MAG: PepSY-like domain-containing protein [Saprospiraceae bacterium]